MDNDIKSIRRNSNYMSIFLGVVYTTNAQFGEMGALINLKFEEPLILHFWFWAIWGYFLFRYWQYFEFKNGKEIYQHNLNDNFKQHLGLHFKGKIFDNSFMVMNRHLVSFLSINMKKGIGKLREQESFTNLQ